MSRDHMLYTQGALQATVLEASDWPKPWDEGALCSGVGILFEGYVHGKKRHTITDSTGAKHRYIILHIEYKTAYKRQYDASGKEIEVGVGSTKKVSTGYLNSSYDNVKGKDDLISADQVHQLIGKSLAKISKATARGNMFEFWGTEEALNKIDLSTRDPVKLKTKGDSPFIELLVRLDAHSSLLTNFSGDKPVGSSWTDKIMGNKSDEPAAQGSKAGEGAADDEWD
eukprot:Opistho-2@54444